MKKYALLFSSNELSVIVVALNHVAKHNRDQDIVSRCAELHDRILNDVGLTTEKIDF